MRLTTALGAILTGVVLLQPLAAAADTFEQGLSAYRSYDYASAFTIWRELARRGDAYSQSSLGFLYRNGLGAPQDHAEAARWFEAAAVQGVPEAQFYLGTMYLEGHGVSVAPDKAHFWCELALNQSLGAALDCRERAMQQMTAEEVLDSWRRVSRWQASPAAPAAAVKRDAPGI